MGRDVPRGLAHHIRELTGLWRTDPRSDGELLAAFVAGNGAAFAALVVRHGQPVWATCLRVLGNEVDAEDAFQATFIALARKASHVRPETIAGWLQKVSCEVALNARKAAHRRAAVQRRLFERASPQTDEPVAPPDEELQAAVSDELARLPERFRVPLALYYLEGKTQAEIGRVLGVTDRAAAHRLKQGLKLLRDRLTRRGVMVAASVLVAVLGNVPVVVAVPAGLVNSTTEAALAVAAGGPTDSLAAQLAMEATRVGGWARLKLCFLLLIPAMGALAGGIFLSQPAGQAAPESPPAPIMASAPTDASPKDRFGDTLPPGAVARFGTLRFRTGNPGGVSSVAFGPSGKVLVSAHGDDSVKFWDPETGREVRKLDGPAGCWAVSATPDGKRLAAVGATEVWLWDLSGDAPKLLWKTQSKSAGPSTVEFSPDGKLIACGGDAGREIRLLDATNGNVSLILPFRGCRFAFSADSKTLASWVWSRSGEVSVWDMATGNKLQTLTAGDEREVVSSVAFSPDGKSLATVGQDKRLRVWSVEKGTELHKLADDADPHSFVGFVPDGTLVEVGGGRVRYWNAKTGRSAKPSAKTAESAWSTAYRLSTDGTCVAAAWPFGVGIWDSATGRELGAAVGMPGGFVHPVAFSRDGKTVATASYTEAAGSSIQVWNAVDGKLQRRVAVAPRQLVWALDFAGDGVLSASLGTLVDLPPKPPERLARWDSGTGNAKPELQLPAETRYVAFAAQGDLLAVASKEGVVLCDPATGREVKKLPGKCAADCLAFSADGKTLAAIDAEVGRVAIWSLPEGRERELKWPVVPPGAAKGTPLRSPVALSPDGRLLAVGSPDPKAAIRVVDIVGGTELAALDGQPHGWPFQEFVFSPDGRTLASAGGDGVVRVWEVASGRERYRFAGHRSAVLGVAFSPDGRRLASASMDSTALLWDVFTPQKSAPAERVTPSQLWAALTSTDAAAAHRAIALLAVDPEASVKFLKERLCAPAPTPEQLRQWLDDLGSGQFAVREAATEELTRLGDQVGPELRRALAATTSPEARGRLERLVAGIGPHSAANRAIVRGVEALERMGRDPAAEQLLKELAKLATDTAAGREARAACRRIEETRRQK